MTTQNALRAAFEKLEKRNSSNLNRDDTGQYENPCTQSAWEGFIAGATHAASPQSATVAAGELPEPDAFMVVQGGDEPVSVHFQRVNAKMTAQRFAASEIVPLYRAEAPRQPAPALPVKPWEARMQEYFAQGSVQMRTPAAFMADEISDLRAALEATQKGAQAMSELKHITLLQNAARAWNNEDAPGLDAAMEEIEIFLLERRTQPPEAVADKVDARRTGTLYTAIQRAAAELPEGWSIALEVERDAGTVELIDPDGERKLIDGNDGYLCQAVDAAINAARQANHTGDGNG